MVVEDPRNRLMGDTGQPGHVVHDRTAAQGLGRGIGRPSDVSAPTGGGPLGHPSTCGFVVHAARQYGARALARSPLAKWQLAISGRGCSRAGDPCPGASGLPKHDRISDGRQWPLDETLENVNPHDSRLASPAFDNRLEIIRPAERMVSTTECER